MEKDSWPISDTILNQNLLRTPILLQRKKVLVGLVKLNQEIMTSSTLNVTELWLVSSKICHQNLERMELWHSIKCNASMESKKSTTILKIPNLLTQEKLNSTKSQPIMMSRLKKLQVKLRKIFQTV